MVSQGAEDGARALDVLAASRDGTPYQVAILDMQMPGMDGLELARRIRADPATATLRLVLLTSLAQGNRQEEAEAGIAAALTKPVRQAQLYATLARVLTDSGGAGPRSEATALSPAELVPLDLVEAPLPDPAAEAAMTSRILVVEDSSINQQVALGMLRRLGYRADAVGNGLEAIDSLERIHYAALLMDCQMPEMDGFEASEEIRRREGGARRTPIIAMTGNAMEGDRERCLAAGMDGYISKPVRIDELQAALACWLSAEATTPLAPLPVDGAEPTGPPLPVLDEATLMDLAPGELDILAELIGQFLADGPARLEAVGAAVRARDAAALREAAHLLKGEAGSIGARQLEGACAALESLARAGQVPGADDGAPSVQTAYAATRDALQQFRARIS
jgi:CheY-like chemotaxis protein/HPt (histidine-containing phosphotransfer) domain-containing protein